MQKIRRKGDPEYGLGLSWLWMLSKKHPFYGCGVWHDYQYDEGTLPREELESRFLALMLRRAERRKGARRLSLITQAYLFAAIARIYGRLGYKRW